MSYILDALTKAEAERKGEPVPEIHVMPAFSATTRNPPPWRRPLTLAAFAAMAISLASAAWYAMSRTPAPASHVVQAPAAPALAVAPPTQAAAPKEKSLSPERVEPRSEKPKEKPAKKPTEKKRPQAGAEPKAAKATPSEPAAALLHELPQQIQREIPPLTVGGYIYSANKADRSVLINKRLLREGDEVAPGLILEKMLPSGMILSYKGYRYRTSY